MSMFLCSKCDQIKDGDYVEAAEDPNDDTKMCCLSCLEDESEMFVGTREALDNLSIRGSHEYK